MRQRLLFLLVTALFCGAVHAQNALVHPWMNKRVAYFGDSITDPKNNGSKVKYWNYLQDWLGITPYVYGISGRQWNDIPNQTDKLKAQHGDEVDAINRLLGDERVRVGDIKPSVGEVGQGDILGIPDGLMGAFFGVVLVETIGTSTINAQKSEPEEHAEPFFVEHERGLFLLFSLVKFQIVISRFPLRVGLRSIAC